MRWCLGISVFIVRAARPTPFHFHGGPATVLLLLSFFEVHWGESGQWSVTRRGHPPQKPWQINLDPKPVGAYLWRPSHRIHSMVVFPLFCLVIGSGHRTVGWLWLKEMKMAARGASPRDRSVQLGWQVSAEPGLSLGVE